MGHERTGFNDGVAGIIRAGLSSIAGPAPAGSRHRALHGRRSVSGNFGIVSAMRRRLNLLEREVDAVVLAPPKTARSGNSAKFQDGG